MTHIPPSLLTSLALKHYARPLSTSPAAAPRLQEPSRGMQLVAAGEIAWVPAVPALGVRGTPAEFGVLDGVVSDGPGRA